MAFPRGVKNPPVSYILNLALAVNLIKVLISTLKFIEFIT
jgi:hypothetical protein